MCIFFNYNSGLGLRKSRVYIIYKLSKFDLSTNTWCFIYNRTDETPPCPPRCLWRLCGHVWTFELMARLLGWKVLDVIHKASYANGMGFLSIKVGIGGLLSLWSSFSYCFRERGAIVKFLCDLLWYLCSFSWSIGVIKSWF